MRNWLCSRLLKSSCRYVKFSHAQCRLAEKHLARTSFALVFFGFAITAPAQPNQPHISYLYPAGGRQGTEFELIVGGQFLRGATDVFITGDGVEATVLEHNQPMSFNEFNTLRDRLRALQQKRRRALALARTTNARLHELNSTNAWTAADEKELAEIRAKLLKNPPNRQISPALAEKVTIKIKLATNATPGTREVRIGTPLGLSNPLKFYVDTLPEQSKPHSTTPNPILDRLLERLNRRYSTSTSIYETRIVLPAIINGQIMPGSVDRYRFTARKGQRVVVIVHARELIPYLADAVPGWFQAAVTLYDVRGNQIAYVDDYRFNPDPVLCYEVPKDGDYILEIKDAIYRGREDFVYRIEIGELPFVTGIFPMGCQAGKTVTIKFTGWNLATAQNAQALSSDIITATNDANAPVISHETAVLQQVKFDRPGVYLLGVTNANRRSNLLPFAVDTLPEDNEIEPNDSIKHAQPIILPIIINGCVSHPSDRDVFKFDGSAGAHVVVEVNARRLGSPLDSFVRLTDACGNQIAFNDDYDDKASGLITHHADSYLHAQLPTNGVYYVLIGDTQQHGGPDYTYRLRISPPVPDFALRVVPASLVVRGGASAPLTIHALRKDGFTNAITLRLKDAPTGFSIAGAHIPENVDQARVTLKAPITPIQQPATVTLEGYATIQNKHICRIALPCEDMMQAFAYRHLVPAETLMVKVVPGRRATVLAGLRIVSPSPVKIPWGGTATVNIATPNFIFTNLLEFQLNDPPTGLALANVTLHNGTVQLEIKSDATKIKPGLKGNLIVDIVQVPPSSSSEQSARRRVVPIGTLPAIPFEIIRID